MMHELGVSGIEMRALWGRFGGAVVAPQLLFFLGLRQGTLAAVVAAGGWTAGLLVYELARRRALDPLVLYGLIFTGGGSQRYAYIFSTGLPASASWVFLLA